MDLTVDISTLDHPALAGRGLIVIDGRAVRVPAEGPARDLVQQVARYLATEAGSGASEAASLRVSLLARIIGTLADLQADQERTEPGPGCSDVIWESA